jgi:hypothetical protein
MLRRLRPHLTYANVMATIALFVALGGSSYAAIKITGKNVKNSSLTWRDLKRNTLGGSRIKESRLGTVPNANRVGGLAAVQLLVRCPPGTFPAGGTCIETRARAPVSYDTAAVECGAAGGNTTLGRRLPILSELRVAFQRQSVNLAAGGELTGHVYPRADGTQDVLYMTSETGNTAIVPNNGNTPKAFRCAVDPIN